LFVSLSLTLIHAPWQWAWVFHPQHPPPGAIFRPQAFHAFAATQAAFCKR